MRLPRFLLVAALTACGSTNSTPPTAPRPLPPADATPVAIDAAAASYSGLGATSIDPDVVAQHAPPPLPPAVSARIQTMLDVRGAPAGVISSRGDRMFFTWRITGNAQVFRVDGPDKFPVQLTGGEDNTVLVGVTSDDANLVVSRDHSGNENPGLYWMSSAGGPLTTIFERTDVQARLAFISDDSKGVFFLANDAAPDSYALHRWDVASGAITDVFTKPGLWSAMDRRPRTGADPKASTEASCTDILLLERSVGNAQNEIYEYDLGTGVLTGKLGVDQPSGTIEEYQARFGARPNTLLVRTDALSDFQRVYLWESGTFTPITPDLAFDVSSLSIDYARTRIYYTVNRGGYRQVNVLDARTLRAITAPRHPQLATADNIQLASLSRDGNLAQFSFDGARLVPTVAAYNFRKRTWTTWTMPSAPGMDPRTFAPITLDTFPARDGTAIPMLVRRPLRCPAPGDLTDDNIREPCPIVVQFHGGPEIQALPGFNPIAQLYVDAGFVFVEPNVRGSSGYGRAWLHADDGPRRTAVVTDIEDCARALRKAWSRHSMTPKLGVYGRSYGGYSSMYAMTAFAGAYDVGVAEVGISDLRTFLTNTAPYRRALRISEYGDPVRDNEALTALSPVTYIDRVTGPMLIMQGVNDPRVPVGEAIQFWKAISARGIPADLILFADEGHGNSKRANQVLSLGHTLAFFEKHLR